MSRWVMMRHGPICTKEKLYTGQRDVHLLEDVDSSAIPEFLYHDFKILSSPLMRCQESLKKMGIKNFLIEHSFMEQNFGNWEGRHYDDVWQDTKENPDWDRPAYIKPEGGESFSDLFERVQQIMQHYEAEYPKEKFFVMTHIGVMRAAIAFKERKTVDDALYIKIPYWGERVI